MTICLKPTKHYKVNASDLQPGSQEELSSIALVELIQQDLVKFLHNDFLFHFAILL
jgi:hypothetical protein